MSPRRPRVLLLESLHADAEDWLRRHADVVDAPDDAVRGVATRGRGRVDRALLEALPSLAAVVRAGVGVDNVDLAAAAERGVTVLNVPDALTDTVAEHAVLLLLAASRELPRALETARSGRWEERESYAGEALAGRSLLVVGYGAIGRRLAELATALGADVRIWSRTRVDDPRWTGDLDAALGGAELVSLHLALNGETRGLFDALRLERLRPGAILVNTARPALVDGEALLAALDAGRVGAYAVDGFEPDPPPPDDPLLLHPRVLVTPHVAALTRGTYRELCLRAVRGIVDVLEGRMPSSVRAVGG